MKFRDSTKYFFILSLMIAINGFPVTANAFKEVTFQQLAHDYEIGDTSSKKTYIEYKTETEPLPPYQPNDAESHDRPAYRLVQTIQSSQTLKDTKGNTYWHREVDNRPEPYYEKDDVKNGYTIISSADIGEYGYNELRYPASIINENGTFPMINQKTNHWELIYKNNKDIELPIQSSDVNCAGFIFSKYWLFSNAILGNDYREYEFRDPDMPESPFMISFYAGDDWTKKDSYLGGKNGYCLFNEDGSLYAKGALPDSLMLKRLFFYPDMGKVIYSYTSRIEEEYYNANHHGIIVATIDGKIIKQTSGINGDTMPWCRFIPGGKYVLLNNGYGLILLSRATGDVLINITGQVRIINSESAENLIVLFTKEDAWAGDLIIYNYNKNKPTYVKQINDVYRIQNFQISLDGTEYDYIFRDYDNEKVTRHYFRLEK